MEFDELLITTGVDALVRLVKEKQRIELEDASSILNIPPESIEDWSRVLEEQGILRIEYRLTKIYLFWVKPTAEEVATETESFYEEKEDIQKQVDAFKSKMADERGEIDELHKSFTDFYAKTYSKIEELEKKVAPIPAGGMLTQGSLLMGGEELERMKEELELVKKGLLDVKQDVGGINVEGTESKKHLDSLETMRDELKQMQDDIRNLRKKAESQSPEDISLPSVRDIKKKMETLNGEFRTLKSRNQSLREDMISLQESSQILRDVAESVMGQEEKIHQMREEVALVSEQAEKMLGKMEEITKKAKNELELVSRLDDSVSVAKGIIKRFPSQEKIMSELGVLKSGEDELEKKYESLETLIEAVGGKQVTSRQFADLAKKMDEKIEQTSRDIDTLETALEDEKNTYLTFQKIKERIVPSIRNYGKQLDDMEERIRKIGIEAVTQKESIRKDAKQLESTLKGGDFKDVLKIAEEVRNKKKMLDEIKDQINELVGLSDNLSKRITLLSREAKLLQIRTGGMESADIQEKEDEIRTRLELTKDEELEFRKKREELKRLIKRLWEE
ncbi:hypothetical protein JXA56_02355 [Candidatus Micrarchaeota archaeon]|nr:hypothetical protein [Candidatus Micrarchaeota archaeon]